MIHLVVNEALLFIFFFTRALYKIMQRDIFSFSIFINPTRVIQGFVPSLALDPTFGIQSHKISDLIPVPSFCYSQCVCVCVWGGGGGVCVCVCVCVCVVRFLFCFLYNTLCKLFW